MRTKAREVAFQTIFASQFCEPEDGLKKYLYKTEKLTPDDQAYCEKIFGVIGEHGEEFAKIIDGRSKAFPESRLFPADKSVLLVALAEIKYFDDIPKAVSINEAANIASKYSSAKSASFVSGILADIEKD